MDLERYLVIGFNIIEFSFLSLIRSHQEYHLIRIQVKNIIQLPVFEIVITI